MNCNYQDISSTMQTLQKQQHFYNIRQKQQLKLEKEKVKMLHKIILDLRVNVESLTRENKNLWKIVCSNHRSMPKKEKCVVNENVATVTKTMDFIDLTDSKVKQEPIQNMNQEEDYNKNSFECDDCNNKGSDCFEELGISKSEYDIYIDLGEPDRCEDCFNKWKKSNAGSEYVEKINKEEEDAEEDEERSMYHHPLGVISQEQAEKEKIDAENSRIAYANEEEAEEEEEVEEEEEE